MTARRMKKIRMGENKKYFIQIGQLTLPCQKKIKEADILDVSELD